MKFALHAWCDKEHLQKADEIIVNYNEKERILDYPDDYPRAAVTIQCFDKNAVIDWDWLNSMRRSFPFGFTLGVLSIQDMQTAISYGIKAYLLTYISTFAELNKLYSEQASYVYLNQPLFSLHDKVQRFNIPVRWTPNIIDANPTPILENIAHGTWIRPEDIELYNIINNCIVEFPGIPSSKAEQALFDIYKKGEWEQDLGLLLLPFKNMNIANYLIAPDFGEARCNCGQLCETFPNGTGCHMCDNTLFLANKKLVTEYFQPTVGFF